MNTIQKAYPEREIARQTGARTYVTGRPCKHGHLSPRNTVDASCVECRRVDRDTRGRERNKLAIRAKRASMSPEEKATVLAAQREWRRLERQRHPERVRERERKHGRIKRQRYPERKLAETRARQTAKIQRTPPWADLAAIREFYENCPPGHEVDHVVPLRGKTVSGLHVLNNLQYLPQKVNRLKGSSFDDWSIAA